MKKFFAGLIAVTIAFLWDRILIDLKIPEQIRVGFLVPIGEELIKIYISIMFHLHPLLIYSFFGLGEGLIEAFFVKKISLYVILAAFMFHSLLGLVYLSPFQLKLELSIVIIGHILWNTVILYRNYRLK